MTRKIPDADFEDAIRAYVSGESAQTASKRFHTTEARLRAALKARGLFRDPSTRYALIAAQHVVTVRPRVHIPMEEIAARYLAGDSENTLAKAYGVTRRTIACRLRALNIPRRDMTAANRLMSGQRTPEERRLYAAASHVANRGIRQSPERRAKIARTNEARRNGVSPAEDLLRLWLSARGLEATPQKAIGPYNADLAVEGVAVEIYGGNWHASGRHARRAPERLRYLLDQGWGLVIIWVDRRQWPLTERAADEIVAFVEARRMDPTSGRQYRMIWGTGEDVPANSVKFQKLALIPSLSAGDGPGT